MTVSTDLLDRARAWAADDPDATTRAEVEALVAAATADPDGPEARDLADRFAGTLEFGTAGLRGALGGGPNRMNRAVVIRAAAGLAAYLKDNGAGPDAAVVIGFDARHYSDVFAQDTAAVMRGAGLRALLLPRPLPTPVLAYAIRKLGCVAGVMVTASHNPPMDNGIKVYDGTGAQIVPPADHDIADAIADVGPVLALPMGEYEEGDVLGAYLEAAAARVPAGPRDVTLV
ncbi:MAG TPA: phospho-sugar mutase, partial [Nocardioides sp.]|nr:phospho-sugar mutase [Nocardioides sp.]